MKRYKELKRLKNIKSICLIAHIEPDPDAISSMIVLRNFLKTKLHVETVDIFAETKILTKQLKEILGTVEFNNKTTKYHTAIMMDSPNSKRLGIYEKLFNSAEQKIVIDHHATNEYLGDINIVEICSSTCEIVYEITKEFKHSLTSQEKGKLYSGIITDTNNFSVGEIDSRTFRIVSELVPYINRDLIYKTFLSNTSLKNKQVEALAINNLTSHENEQIIISHISHNEAKNYQIAVHDYDGIINNLAKINTASLICLIESKHEKYYVSMRAKHGLDVSQIAKNNGGGGHTGAAAFTSCDEIENIKTLILNSFKEELKNHKPTIKNLFW